MEAGNEMWYPYGVTLTEVYARTPWVAANSKLHIDNTDDVNFGAERDSELATPTLGRLCLHWAIPQ